MIEVANQVLAEKLNQDAGIGDPTQVQRLLGMLLFNLCVDYGLITQNSSDCYNLTKINMY